MPSSTPVVAARIRELLDKVVDRRHTLADALELETLTFWLIARLEAYETERDPQ